MFFLYIYVYMEVWKKDVEILIVKYGVKVFKESLSIILWVVIK